LKIFYKMETNKAVSFPNNINDPDYGVTTYPKGLKVGLTFNNVDFEKKQASVDLWLMTAEWQKVRQLGYNVIYFEGEYTFINGERCEENNFDTLLPEVTNAGLQLLKAINITDIGKLSDIVTFK